MSTQHRSATRVVRLELDSVGSRTSPIVDVQVAPRDQPLATREVTLGQARVVCTVGPLS